MFRIIDDTPITYLQWLTHVANNETVISHLDSVLKDIQRASEEEPMEFDELISEINNLTLNWSSVLLFILEENNMEQATCFEEKPYFEVPLAQVLKFRPYRKLLFCIYLMFLDEDITQDEIRQKLNNIDSFDDFKRLWWTSIWYFMEIDSSIITYENWKRCVANSTKVIEFLYKHRRHDIPPRV